MLENGPLAKLTAQLASLPGIGPKSAQRLAFYLINQPPQVAQELAKAIVEARASINQCPICHYVSDQKECPLCQDFKRDSTIICVVEQPKDVLAMEKSHTYRGLYHVLQGCLSPLNGIGPDNLTIRDLLKRLEAKTVQEVVLATNPTVEGDATAIYLSRLLEPLPIRVTRLARGLPVGASLEFADEITLAKALEGRREF